MSTDGYLVSEFTTISAPDPGDLVYMVDISEGTSGSVVITYADFFSNIGSNGIDVNPGSDTDADLVTVGVTGSPTLSWDESADGFYFTKGLYIGDSTATSSVDPMVNVNRDLDDTGSGNAHCFSDSTQVDRTGTIGYNSFDARITVGGSEDYLHFACHQNGITLGTSGTTAILYGFVDAPTVNTGIVTYRYGTYINEVIGTGTITNQHGVHIEELTAGTSTNYAIFTQGATASRFSGHLEVGANHSNGTVIAASGSVDIATHYGIQTQVASSGISVGFDAYNRTYGTSNCDSIQGVQLRPSHGSSGKLVNFYGTWTGLTNTGGLCTNAHGHYVADAAGAGSVTNQYGLYVATLAKGGTSNWGVYVAGNDCYFGGDTFSKPSASVSPTNVGEMVIEATNDTTLTFKFKGSDGSVRTGTLSLSTVESSATPSTSPSSSPSASVSNTPSSSVSNTPSSSPSAT